MLDKFLTHPLLALNFAIELTLGLTMVIYPQLITSLGGVDISEVLLRTCGMLALSVSAFSLLSIYFIINTTEKHKVKNFVYLNLLIFNLALTIGLLYAAITGEISYLGAIVHAPLALAFAVSLYLSYKR
ncbi:MAG: hypothetical protein NT111_03120 [Patescibacteria group bacterium]|jgi:hypothetical protein|nr:hypothetical protein [Patescibacteria group bacterium]